VALVRKRTIPTERQPLSAQRIPTAVNLDFLDPEPLFFQPLSYHHEAELTPFQTHYFSENLVASGIEPDTPGSVARNSGH
jgi:hypothetical protein